VSDIFSEVEEEVRRERWEKLWKNYNGVIIAAAAIIVTAVAGWQAWDRYQLSQREAASATFNNAMTIAEAGNITEAETALTALASDGPAGYAMLAEFQLVKTDLLQGRVEQATARLRELAAEDSLLGHAARIQLAWILAETGTREEIEGLIAPLQGAESPWRFAAAEVDAFLDLKAGDRDAAAAGYQALAVDPGVPEGQRQRAGAIAQFLRANAPQTTIGDATGGAEEIANDEAAADDAPPAEEAPTQ